MIDYEYIENLSSDDILRLLIYEYLIDSNFYNYSISEYSINFYNKYSDTFNYFSYIDLDTFKYNVSERLSSLLNSDFNFDYIYSIYDILRKKV